MKPLLVVSLAALALLGPSCATGEESAVPNVGATLAPDQQRVRSYVNEVPGNGRLRMIVHLEIDTTSEPALRPKGGEVAVLEQRLALRRAQEAFVDAVELKNGASVQYSKTRPYLVADFTADEIEAIATNLFDARTGRFEFVFESPSDGRQVIAFDLEPDVPLELHGSSGASSVAMKESLELIQAFQVHALGAQGDGMTIVVIDDGVDGQLPHLANPPDLEKVVGGSFHTSGAPENMGSGPRTSCCGIPYARPRPAGFSHGSKIAIAAAGTILDHNGVDVRGVAPEAQIIAVRVMGSNGVILASDIKFALEEVVVEWSHCHDIAAVCMSLGSEQTYEGVCSPSTPALAAIANEIKALDQLGIPVVCSVGNQQLKKVATFPACLEEVVAVACTSSVDGKVVSNWSEEVDLVAPAHGMSIPRITNNGDLPLGFSSMAAAQVAGAVAALKDVFPHHSAKHILDILGSTGAIVEYDGIENPRLQLEEAYMALLPQ